MVVAADGEERQHGIELPQRRGGYGALRDGAAHVARDVQPLRSLAERGEQREVEQVVLCLRVKIQDRGDQVLRDLPDVCERFAVHERGGRVRREPSAELRQGVFVLVLENGGDPRQNLLAWEERLLPGVGRLLDEPFLRDQLLTLPAVKLPVRDAGLLQKLLF